MQELDQKEMIANAAIAVPADDANADGVSAVKSSTNAVVVG